MPRPHVHLRDAALVGAVAALASLVLKTSRPAKPVAAPAGGLARSAGRSRHAATTALPFDQDLVDAGELGLGITLGGTLIDADHLLVVLTDKLGMARRLIPLHGLEWPLGLLWLTRGRTSLLGIPTTLVRGWAIGMIVHLAIDVQDNPARLPDLSLLYRAITGRTGQRLPASRGTRWLKEPVWKWI